MNMLSHRTIQKCLDKGTKNEDVFMAAGRSGSGCSKFVLADGATTGFSGGRFAHSLAWSFMSTAHDVPWRKRFKLARERFDSQFNYRQLNWFQRQNYWRGSFSTLLTGEVVRDGVLLTAVGDSCAFLLDKSSLSIRKAFPVEYSYDFSTNPYLIGSHNSEWLFEPKWKKTCWHNVLLRENEMRNCWLLCATDAVAEYVLKHRQESESMRSLVCALESNRSFAAWIERKREAGDLQVDDSTVALIDP